LNVVLSVSWNWGLAREDSETINAEEPENLSENLDNPGGELNVVLSEERVNQWVSSVGINAHIVDVGSGDGIPVENLVIVEKCLTDEDWVVELLVETEGLSNERCKVEAFQGWESTVESSNQGNGPVSIGVEVEEPVVSGGVHGGIIWKWWDSGAGLEPSEASLSTGGKECERHSEYVFHLSDIWIKLLNIL